MTNLRGSAANDFFCIFELIIQTIDLVLITNNIAFFKKRFFSVCNLIKEKIVLIIEPRYDVR